MLRLLGFVLIVVICVDVAPWALLVGAILFSGWALLTPATSPAVLGRWFPDEQLSLTNPDGRSLSAIPLHHAVFCANCDLITNSPHDDCGVCGSHSVIAVSRIWQLTLAETPTKAARYKVSFTADVCEIPANDLNESTKLIGRLAELGGKVRALHIQVDPVFNDDAVSHEAKIELLKPMGPTSTTAWEPVRQAS